MSINNSKSKITVVFDKTNICWTKDRAVNLYFLRVQERYVNDMLTAKEKLLLNDVFDTLGFPRTAYGLLAGFVKGDGFIDFGIDWTKFNDDPNITLTFEVRDNISQYFK